MDVVIIGPNLRDQSKGQFRAHERTCRDLDKDMRLTREQPWFFDQAVSRREIVEDLYPPGEFEWSDGPDDVGYWDDVWFAPCLKGLPREEKE